LFRQETKSEWFDWLKTYDQVLWLEKDDISFERTAFQEKIAQRDWHAFREQLDQEIGVIVAESGLPWKKLAGSIDTRLGELQKTLGELRFSIEGVYTRKKEQK
jgi:hypothetical protein